MSLKIYFVRHGETTYSQTGGFCGAIDPELTPAGSQMAEQFAATYAKLPWNAVYVSPMKRTIATAKPLCDAVGIEMQLRDGLREINYGDWEGKTVEAVKKDYEEDYINWLTEPAWNAPTNGGETSVEIASRSSLVIAEIQEKYKNGNVLVVSHKATIRIILCSLLGIDLGSYRNRIAALAASISIVKFDVRGPMLEVLGDRSHLDENLRNLPGT
ncbi:histidine phosphatase family protein [Microcoleus sp. ARI1-B5]|uniref:histidine phosphatase family protein n=1 Tax=unclassified Microcoleus TaxID=2642155 RepID=UPI002FD2DDC4